MFKQQIIDLLKQVVDAEFHSLIEVFVSPEVAHGDYSTNIAMILARHVKTNPMQLAAALVDKLNLSFSNGMKGSTLHVARVEVAKPGYINFFLKPEAYSKVVQEVLAQNDNYGQNSELKNKKIMVEYGHPNPFKVMHIGHLRNFCLGVSIARLLEASGATVIRTNYQGDVGMHVAKCVWALQKKIRNSKFEIRNGDVVGANLDSPDARVKLLSECYVEGAKAFEESEENKKEIIEVNKKIYTEKEGEVHELWKLGVKWSLEKFHQIYDRLDSHFEREYLESETLEVAKVQNEEAIKKGILVKSKGAIIFNGEPYKLDTRVFLNSEGLPTYEGKELGLAQMEFKDFGHIDLCVHNVAVEQKSFFEVTFKVEELLNPELFKGKQYHNAYEFVGLKSGKMSSRKGQVVTAELILDEAHKAIAKVIVENKSVLPESDVDAIALAAVKYSFLKMSAFKYLAFDITSSVSMSGDSGPYLQYTYARCKSVLRKSPESRVTSHESKEPRRETQDARPATHAYEYNNEELAILKALAKFPEVVETATKSYDPHFVAVYLNELAQTFNTFYNKHSILSGEQMELRINLTQAVSQVLKNGLYLLGIRTVERM
ncbi:MAG: arginine--tRNA ligase [Patescibacteria group bacterium]|jgi:arginyl-tRNA synthetase